PRQVEQRAEHEDRNAVQPGERVGHPGPDLRPALDPDLRLADLDVDAECLQHGRGYADLAHIRGVLDAALPVAQHGGDHVLGNRVLRPPDHDVAAKRARGFYHPDLLFNHEVSLTGRYHRSGPATIEGAWRDEGSTRIRDHCPLARRPRNPRRTPVVRPVAAAPVPAGRG